MKESIDRRLDLLKHKERELRDRATLSQSSLDNTFRLENMLSAVTSEIAQLEIQSSRSNQ
jgi:hypothetical protein